MSDLYKEILVKKQQTAGDKAKRIGLIAGTVIFFVAGIITVQPLLLIPAVGLGIASYFLLPSTNLEYEYLYVNGDFDIDRIMGQQKRKRCASYDNEALILAAPTGSHELDSYLSNGKGKVFDYTSHTADTPSWTLVYQGKDGNELVRLELDETVIKDLRRIAPRKIART